MKRMSMCGPVSMAVFLAMALAVSAGDESFKETKLSDKQVADLAALKTQKQSLETQIAELNQKLGDVLRPLSAERERLVKTDSELAAMSREIAAKQAALDKRLHEKYPDLAAKAKERDALMEKSSALRVELNEVQERMFEVLVPDKKAREDLKKAMDPKEAKAKE